MSYARLLSAWCLVEVFASLGTIARAAPPPVARPAAAASKPAPARPIADKDLPATGARMTRYFGRARTAVTSERSRSALVQTTAVRRDARTGAKVGFTRVSLLHRGMQYTGLGATGLSVGVPRELHAFLFQPGVTVSRSTRFPSAKAGAFAAQRDAQRTWTLGGSGNPVEPAFVEHGVLGGVVFPSGAAELRVPGLPAQGRGPAELKWSPLPQPTQTMRDIDEGLALSKDLTRELARGNTQRARRIVTRMFQLRERIRTTHQAETRAFRAADRG